MSNSNYTKITRDGLWDNNIAFVQILGLCPLLAVSSTATNGLGLGIATTLVLIASNMTVSLIRNMVRPEIRIPVFMLIIASFVTAVELAMNAWFYDLYKVLGIFIPLIVTNCAILGRAEAFAARNPLPASIVDGLSMGIGFTLVLVVLGAIREILGFGTLFAKADLMFGESVSWMSITLINNYDGFLLAILPPGAFIGLGLLAALKNVIDARMAKNRKLEISIPATEAVENSQS
ncbi:MAG: electron transport complex subunit E [Gammaproteobacteria bacterium]|nr:electron transport complex subunit E [Gammaproteobacteria bacterium]